MPLNRPALSLGSGARGVQDARRWVVGTCRDIGRDDLVESAEIGVSELVTNALLHGVAPIEVRVRGTREHPRVEVRDGSTQAPELPGSFDPESLVDDDLLLTFGRGLSIVARASDAWGAEIEVDGKVVWFAPAAEFADDDGPTGVITGVGTGAEQTGEQPTDLVRFTLNAVPVKDYLGFQRHFRELRREVRLLALAHEADYPLAKDLSDVFGSLGRPLRLDHLPPEITAARASGQETVDLRLVLSRAAALKLDRFIELLELTDAFCREERMLALARTPAQHAFQNWLLGELVDQARGEEPRPFDAGTGSGTDSGAEGVNRGHAGASATGSKRSAVS